VNESNLIFQASTILQVCSVLASQAIRCDLLLKIFMEKMQQFNEILFKQSVWKLWIISFK